MAASTVPGVCMLCGKEFDEGELVAIVSQAHLTNNLKRWQSSQKRFKGKMRILYDAGNTRLAWCADCAESVLKIVYTIKDSADEIPQC